MATSLRDQVNQQLTEYADIVKKYFVSLSVVADNSTNVDEQNSPEQLIKRIIAVDNNLQKSVDQIEEHQSRQQQIIQVQEEIQHHNLLLLQIIQKLNVAREEINKHLLTAKDELKATQYASEANVSFKDVLSYASKLSKYTSAPPNFDTLDKDSKIDFEKPYPDEERMRKSLLYWQNSSHPNIVDKFESSEEEISENEEMDEIHINRHNEDTGGDPLWILDLNPDMSS